MCSSDSNVVCEGEHDRVTPDTWGWTHTLRTVSYILFLIVGSEKNVKLFLKIYVYANCQRDAGPFLPLPAGKKSKVWRDLSFIYSMNIFHFNWFLDSVRTDLIPSFTLWRQQVCVSYCTPEVVWITEGASLIMAPRLIWWRSLVFCVLSHPKYWVRISGEPRIRTMLEKAHVYIHNPTPVLVCDFCHPGYFLLITLSLPKT